MRHWANNAPLAAPPAGAIPAMWRLKGEEEKSHED